MPIIGDAIALCALADALQYSLEKRCLPLLPQMTWQGFIGAMPENWLQEKKLFYGQVLHELDYFGFAFPLTNWIWTPEYPIPEEYKDFVPIVAYQHADGRWVCGELRLRTYSCEEMAEKILKRIAK